MGTWGHTLTRTHTPTHPRMHTKNAAKIPPVQTIIGTLSFASVSTLSALRNRKIPRAARLTVTLNDTSRCPELVSGPSAVGFFELMPA